MTIHIYWIMGLLLAAQDTDFQLSVWKLLQTSPGYIRQIWIPGVIKIKSDLWIVIWRSRCPKFPSGLQQREVGTALSLPQLCSTAGKAHSLPATAQWWTRHGEFHGLLPSKYSVSAWHLLDFCSPSHRDPLRLLSSTIRGLTSKPPDLGYCSLLDWSQLVSENFIPEKYLTNDSPVSFLQQCLQKPTGSGCKFIMRILCRVISAILFSVSTNLHLLFPATVGERGIK